MLHVTESAAKQLRSLLQERPATNGTGLRVQVAKGGCSGMQYEMSLASPQPEDQVVTHDGVQFFVDQQSASYLEGATLDYHDGLTGAGFTIVNPNAARTCGCGSSFEPAKSA